jgi:hypothetical protein
MESGCQLQGVLKGTAFRLSIITTITVALQAAEKLAIGQERRTSGPKGRRIFNRLWPD